MIVHAELQLAQQQRCVNKNVATSCLCLLQATTQDSVVSVITAVNQLIQQSIAATGPVDPTAVQQQLAAVAGVVQTQIVPAILPLVQGTISPADFTAQFTGSALANAVAAYVPPTTTTAAAPGATL